MKKVTLRKYSDPGHGWYAVPVALIEKLSLDLTGFDRVITNRKGRAIFLEEDCEIEPIVIQLKNLGIEVNVKEFHCNKQSKVRNYPLIDPKHLLSFNNSVNAMSHFTKDKA